MRYLPWIAPLALCVVLIPFVDGAARGLLTGIVVGLAAGAGLAWATTRVNRHIAATTLASITDELKAESDQRAAMVIRQFEWAVNDVANLREALQRAQDSRATAEANEHRVKRRQRHLERQLYEARMKIGEHSRALGSESPAIDDEPTLLPTGDELVVPLIWRVFEENMLTWLRFESAGIVPSQIRIKNEHDSVIAISAHSLDTLKEGAQVSLVLAVVGTCSGSHGTALRLTGLAFAIEAISITSLGGGLIYPLFVAPLLLLTLVLIATRRADSRTAPLG